jgi:hypothetical protein
VASAGADALIRDLQVARLRFEAGAVPDGLDDLLARLDGTGIEKIAAMASGVRGLLEEGPSPASHAMIATSFSLAEVFLRLHHLEPGQSRQ